MSATPLKVSTTPIFPAISRDKMNKDFQVLLNIEAPPAANSHVPIDVVVVLDVSGSMNDPVVSSPAPESSHASRLDVLKAAMRFVVRTLDEGDRLSIVAFNDGLVKEYSTGLLDISGDGRSIAGRKVEQLEARGGTALMPALEKAIRILDERAGNSRSRLGFILLLTDGDDTSGFRWSRDAIHGALSRYPVHTFGLGSAHDPEPLLHIAQESRGTYSFVEDENLDKIAGSLAVCVGGLKTVAAVDTRVTLKAVELSGARIERIDSGGFESRVACGGASGEVVIGVLYAGEVKSFVVHLNVPASSSSSAECGYCDGDTATVCDFLHHCHHFRQQHLLDVGCKYAHAPGAAAVSIDGDGVFVQRPEVGAVAVDGNRPVVLPSPVVLQHLVRFELLELVAGVAESEMLVKATKQPHGNSRAGDVLQSKWEEFRRGRQFWGGVELDGVAKEVDAMVSSLGRGLGYVGSWVSSQQMQRATAMGSPDKVVAEFLPPAMVTTLEKAQKLPPPAAISGCAGAGAGDDDLYEVIGQRLELWSKVRREAPLMYKPSSSSSEEEELMTALFREASLEAIDRAMHRDIYLAVVHASNQRRLYDGRNDRAPGR
uniref:VWFA domain-containing protein n=1 Tax=Oryza brachyantha TaxID=4533 RepID=J3NAA3_ORYBR